MSWSLIVHETFSAAHFLKNYRGKCEKMHGHTFELEVHLNVNQLNESGISIDFSDIKDFLRTILPDHCVLNEIYDFSPSAENLSRSFFQQIAVKYPVTKVIVWESANAGAQFTKD